MANITLMRHGKTLKNGWIKGRWDIPLSNDGMEQIRKLPKTVDYDIILCSPLKRTKQTAKILYPNKEIQEEQELIEINLGEWEGRKEGTVSQELFRKYQEGLYVPKGAETKEEVFLRIKQIFSKIVKNYSKEEEILLVTHSGLIIAIMLLAGIKNPQAIKYLETFKLSEKQIKLICEIPVADILLE